MIYVFLGDGFEEIEAIAPVDILRRGGVEVKTVSITDNKCVRGSHDIFINADLTISEIELNEINAIILPGGMPGTLNLENSEVVSEIIDYCYNNGLLICAICAAPSILGHKGILNGKNAVCYPGFEKDLLGAEVKNTLVCHDGNFVTGRGPGAAIPFGIEILKCFKGEEAAEKIGGGLIKDE